MRRLLLGLVALMPTTSLAHDYKVGDLVINHPKIVETPPGAKVAAGYLTVVNNGSSDDRLVAIESTVIPKIEMHTSTVTDGVARMTEMDGGMVLPAGKSVALGDAGTHAMFTDLTKQLKQGEKIEAVLVFEKAGRVPVVFNVEKRSAQKAETHDHP
ncbi:copper chaperone PCu(A)C [Agrobacterium vaccinii]|uniref:copper chaperone PCu(A)C n=1 Tax=Agrobacterium vaccinii TaxID=2735528 RepID=UPI001E55DC30|nr:copper chaperone PCu(A)C [Agrobacterium vaccinii]